MKLKFYSTLIAYYLIIHSIVAQTPQVSFNVFGTGFSNPVSIAHAGDSRLFIVEQNGKIQILNPDGSNNPTPFLDISSLVNQTGNERGLLGLAFHPDYTNNGYFYVNYTAASNGATKIARYKVNSGDANLADASSAQIIMTIAQPYTNHNGGNILFGPDGYLYIGMGDGGNGGDPDGYAQNRLALLGKMLRIDVNTTTGYSIPSSNPFYGMSSVRNEIWAIGLRNPWRFSFDKISGDLWIGDVGQNAWEEIDFQPASSAGGENYGWRCYEGNAPYNTAGCQPSSSYTTPVYEYINSGTTGCSVTAGYVYRGAEYGALFGWYLFSDYCIGILHSLRPDGVGGYAYQNLGQFLNYQYSAFGEDNNGNLYLAGRENGNIYKMSESTCLPSAWVSASGSTAICQGDSVQLKALQGTGFTYQWKKDNVNIQGANNPVYTDGSQGVYSVIVTNPNGCSNSSNLITITTCIGIDDNQSTFDIQLYPNPATDKLNISLKSKTSGRAQFEFYTMDGRLMQTQQEMTKVGDNQFIMDVSHISSGIYFLQIKNNGIIFNKKFTLLSTPK